VIVKDSTTKKEAIKLLQSSGKIFYSDKYLFSAIVFTPNKLTSYIDGAFLRGEIAIVGKTQEEMEFYDFEQKTWSAQQRKQEMKDAHVWFKTHPREVAKVLKRVEAREKVNA
jgi:hypothetical protein